MGAPGIDVTPPDSTITQGPASTTLDTDATLSFTSNDDTATFRCRLDGGPWRRCTSPHTYQELPTGAHEAQVAAVDPSGNVDPSPASHTWTITEEPPPDNLSPATGRLALGSRFGTAVEIAQAQFPDGAGTVYLARAHDPLVDAVAAGSLTQGPVLLVPPCGDVPGEVLAEIDRLDPERVVALGGTTAICDATLQHATNGAR